MMNPHSLAVGQAAEIAHAYRGLIVACFLIGHILRVAVQIDGLAKSHPSPQVSDLFVLRSNVVSVAFRFFVSLMVFLAIWTNPAGIVTLLGYAGFTVSQNAAAVLTFPMNPWFAGLWGVTVDWILGNIPKLKTILPSVEFTTVETNVRETNIKETHTVTSETAPVLKADDPAPVAPEEKP